MSPDVACLFPQDRDGLKVGGIDEVLDGFKVFLGADAYNLEDLLVVSSELLDVRGVPQTGRSIRRPIPQQDWTISGHDLAQACYLTGLAVEQLGLDEVIGEFELELVLFCRGDRRQRFLR